MKNRWQAILRASLDRDPGGGPVLAIVRAALGREPTHSEHVAALRAARLLSRRGGFAVALTRTRDAIGRRNTMVALRRVEVHRRGRATGDHVSCAPRRTTP